MKYFFKLSLFAFLSIFFLNATSVSAQKMTRDEKKKMKMLMKTDWETKNIEKDGRIIDFNSIGGKAYMYFYQTKEKKDGKKQKVDKWKMNIGGQDRIFDYRVKGDSIQFIEVNGWNDFRIINLEKDRLSVDHVLDGNLIRWNMVPKKKEEF